MNKIDGILYINLDYRTDRKEQLLNNLKKYNVDINKVHRIPAVLTKQCGHLGCGMSHVKAIKYAISQKWDNVLILEDDFIFTANKDNIDSDLEKIMDEPWDALLLSHCNLRINNNIATSCKNIKRVLNATCTPAYILKKHYFETLLNCFENSVNKIKKQLAKHLEKHTRKLHYVSAIDQEWGVLQRKDVFYTFSPSIGTQRLISDNNISIAYQDSMIAKFNAQNQ